ncbi:hypothetical protein [Flavobacterium sp.]|uniref:hypothetical protein n=1 Tax=Flavobacterium sp. TaxID=239 RepID=UPI00262CFF09|nr:hypothetical protein [Flavobacterium sp.]
MIEVKIEDKQNYLSKNYPFAEPPELKDKKECIHCGEIITVGDFKVFKDELGNEYICCPNAPKCDGTVIDWMLVGYKHD